MQMHAVSTMLGGRGTGPPGPRGVRGVASRVGGVEKGIVLDHIAAKLIGPFENLGSNVVEEGVGGPASQEHDLGDGMVHEKEGHGGSGSEGFGSDVRRFISEGGCPAKEGAGGSEVEEEQFAGEKDDFGSVSGGIDSCTGDSARGEAKYSLDNGGQPEDGAHHRVVGALVGSLVVLRSVFLVSECERDSFRRFDRRVGVGNDSITGISENNPVKSDDLGSAWCWGGCGFTRPHGEEESHDGEVADDGKVCVSGVEVGGS